MKYVVIRYFRDAQDNDYPYHEGDIYPREGLTVSNLRIKDLMNGNNFQQVPLIRRDDSIGKFTNKTKEPVAEAIKEEKVEETHEFTSEEIDKMPFMKLKSVARKNGVPIEDREAKDIRSDLKKELGL